MNSSWIEIFKDSCSPVQREMNCQLKVTEGQLPSALHGTLYRNGPGKFAAGSDSYSHLFDGDGMVSSFRISEGQIHYRNAYVKTTEFLEEEAAGRMLYRGFGSNLPGGLFKNAFRTRFKNAANTNIIFHEGALLALWEGGWPHQLNPETLETESRYHFDRRLCNRASIIDRIANPELPFSAHPKKDPATGRLYNFGLAFGVKNRLMIYEVGQDGVMLEPRFLKLNDLSFIHDFLITSQSKAIFFCTPIHFNLVSMLSGLESPASGMRGDPSEAVRILVVDLNGPPGEIAESDVQIFESPYSFVFHHVNAFEENGKIEIFSAEMDSFPNAEAARKTLQGEEVEYPLTRLVQTTLIRGQKTAQRNLLPLQGFELPRIEESLTGLAFSSFFVTGVQTLSQFPFMDQIQKVSRSGELQKSFHYADGLVGEPVIVSAAHEKWVLSVCYNHKLKKSELVILDEASLNLLAKAELPHSQPLGFHGNWVAKI